ncbi:hypothetical protein DFH08DRAFT_277380 [Mycena albidolilacea]|uniref:Pectinesterase catalytic domain-containing protein n=1 Tax=Mycena albidolilacea TaxID=1033008 RepID=A0AAD7APW4_9AGAR|nr:hypothetical protein DFH08DRAFT_277380 [Mycena albidolilacea]
MRAGCFHPGSAPIGSHQCFANWHPSQDTLHKCGKRTPLDRLFRGGHHRKQRRGLHHGERTLAERYRHLRALGCLSSPGLECLNATPDVLNENTVITAADVFHVTGNVFLGRSWGDFARVVLKNTYIPAPRNKTIWSIWNPSDERTDSILFAGYNSFAPGVAHAHHVNFCTVLGREEAAQYTKVGGGL